MSTLKYGNTLSSEPPRMALNGIEFDPTEKVHFVPSGPEQATFATRAEPKRVGLVIPIVAEPSQEAAVQRTLEGLRGQDIVYHADSNKVSIRGGEPQDLSTLKNPYIGVEVVGQDVYAVKNAVKPAELSLLDRAMFQAAVTFAKERKDWMDNARQRWNEWRDGIRSVPEKTKEAAESSLGVGVSALFHPVETVRKVGAALTTAQGKMVTVAKLGGLALAVGTVMSQVAPGMTLKEMAIGAGVAGVSMATSYFKAKVKNFFTFPVKKGVEEASSMAGSINSHLEGLNMAPVPEVEATKQGLDSMGKALEEIAKPADPAKVITLDAADFQKMLAEAARSGVAAYMETNAKNPPPAISSVQDMVRSSLPPNVVGHQGLGTSSPSM